MTKVIFILFTVVLFSINSLKAQQIVSLHSIKAGIPSITYSYEHALGKQFSINIEAGVNWSWSSGTNSTGKYSFKIFPFPVLQLEPRLYYSVKRRFEIDRFNNNSASFFCVTTSVQSPILQGYGRSYFSVIPKWGFRRAMGKHFIFETKIGGGINFNSYTSNFAPGFDLKLGYAF